MDLGTNDKILLAIYKNIQYDESIISKRESSESNQAYFRYICTNSKDKIQGRLNFRSMKMCGREKLFGYYTWAGIF